MVNVTNGRRSAKEPPTSRPITLPTAIADTARAPVEESTRSEPRFAIWERPPTWAPIAKMKPMSTTTKKRVRMAMSYSMPSTAPSFATFSAPSGSRPRWAGDGTSNGSVARIDTRKTRPRIGDASARPRSPISQAANWV